MAESVKNLGMTDEEFAVENEDFKKVFEAHRGYKKQVDEIEKKHLLSAQDEVEIKRLKKLKLALKDEMEKIRSVAG